MGIELFFFSVLASWVASVLLFPILPFQPWLNSTLRWILLKVTFRQVGLTGRWLAVYELPSKDHGSVQRREIVKCRQLNGGELRGTIKDQGTRERYKFLGRLVFDEFVAHYWSVNESRDIGNFKFTIKQGGNHLEGNVSLYNTTTKKTHPKIRYHWYRLPNIIVQILNKVYSNRSPIHRIGLFSNRRVFAGQNIGTLALGKTLIQGKYTVEFKGKHKLVKEPWMYLNHSCVPNAQLEFKDNKIVLKAKDDIFPHCELTVDYSLLNEKIEGKFDCNCSKCNASGLKKHIY